MISLKLIVSLIIVIYAIPAQAETLVALGNGLTQGEMLLADNGRSPRIDRVSERVPRRPESFSGMPAVQRNVPPGHNRRFGYGFERRHAQPGDPTPAPPHPN